MESGVAPLVSKKLPELSLCRKASDVVVADPAGAAQLLGREMIPASVRELLPALAVLVELDEVEVNLPTRVVAKDKKCWPLGLVGTAKPASGEQTFDGCQPRGLDEQVYVLVWPCLLLEQGVDT